MRNLLILSAAVLPFSVLAVAQDVVPVIYLSTNEAASAKQFSRALVNASDRNTRALVAWRNFRQSYQAQHPELPNLKFAPDFRVAFAWKESGHQLPLDKEAAAVELSASERQHAESLYQEMLNAKRALDDAQRDWQDFWHELVVDHITQTGHESSWVEATLANGQKVKIPSPWTNGISLTPDFRIAVPH